MQETAMGLIIHFDYLCIYFSILVLKHQYPAAEELSRFISRTGFLCDASGGKYDADLIGVILCQIFQTSYHREGKAIS